MPQNLKSGLWLGALSQQTITWANVDPDLCHYMVSPSHNELGCNMYLNSISRRICVVLLCLSTHWGWVTHICVSKLTIIGSDNGMSPDRRQAIIWTNDGLLWIGPLGTNFIEILIEILTFSFNKMHLKVSSAKRRPFCPVEYIHGFVVLCFVVVILLELYRYSWFI